MAENIVMFPCLYCAGEGLYDNVNGYVTCQACNMSCRLEVWNTSPKEYVFKPWYIVAFEVESDSSDYLACIYPDTRPIQLGPEERKAYRLFTMRFGSQEECWNFFGMNAHTMHQILKAQGRIG